MSDCVIIQEVNNWLQKVWPGHYSEHWVHNFFTSLTVYGASFTSDMNQLVHPLESWVLHMVWSWNYTKQKILIDTPWENMLTYYVIPLVWWPMQMRNFSLVSHSQKLKNDVVNELFVSRGLGGEFFKLIPPVDSKIWHCPYFSLYILPVTYDGVHQCNTGLKWVDSFLLGV